MSVLETFFIMFKTDADKAAESVKKVETAADQTEKALEGVDTALTGAATEAKKVSAEMDKLPGRAVRTETAVEGVDRALTGAAIEAGKAATQVDKLGDKAARAEAHASRLSASFMDMVRNLAAPALALFSVGGLGAAVTQRAAHVLQLDQFSAKLNSTVQDVDAFQMSVVEAGGNGEQALDALATYAERIGEAMADKEGSYAKDLAKWGVVLKDAKGNALGAVDAFVELAGSLEKVSKTEALGRLSMLGITDAATIEFLLRGKNAVRETLEEQRRLGVVTEEQVEQTRDYYTAVGRLRNAWGALSGTLSSAVLPAVGRAAEVLGGVFRWMGRNQKLVEGFFIGVAGAITAYFLPAIYRAAAATIAATWPFLAIGAAVAAVGAIFALAYEDVRAFLDGQPSLIGKLAERYEWFADVVRGIGKVFTFLQDEWSKFMGELAREWDNLKAVFTEIGRTAADVARGIGEVFAPLGEALGRLMEASGKLIETVRSLFAGWGEFGTAAQDGAGQATSALEGVKSVLDTLDPIIRAVADVFRTVLGGAVSAVAALVDGLAATVGAISDAISGVATRLSGMDANVSAATADAAVAQTRGGLRGALRQNSLGAGQSALGAAGSAPQGLAAGAGNVSQTSNVNVGPVTVNTQATDAAGVARAVRGELQNQLRDTSAQFDTGVDR